MKYALTNTNKTNVFFFLLYTINTQKSYLIFSVDPLKKLCKKLQILQLQTAHYKIQINV